MANYTDQYIQSILTMLSYSTLKSDNEKENFIGKDLKSEEVENDFINILKTKEFKSNFDEFTATIDFFTDNFEIINQESSITNGFSATTYRLKNDIEGSNYKAGELFVSYRGTQPLDMRDWLTDLGLSLSSRSFLGIFKLSQEADAISYLDDLLKKETYAGTKINISGHSLGGYLAARTYYYTDDAAFSRIGDVTTFNGAGFSALFYPFIDSSRRAAYAEKVTNYYSFRGFNVTAGNLSETSLYDVLDGKGTVISTFQHLGPRVETYTENPGGPAGNHSVAMLVKTMGIYSILEKIVHIPSSIGDNEKSDYQIKTFNKLMMQTIPSSKDFGIAYELMTKTLINLFNIPLDIIEGYSTWTAKFISLKDYFNDHPDLKIRLISDMGSTPSIDTNANRAYMYSLINNLSYFTEVPESYNTGIYQKHNADGSEYLDNRKYDISYYTDDYIYLRRIYNSVYSQVLEQKILADLPSSFEIGETILSNGLKYAFLDEINSKGIIDKNRVIYVNTNVNEYVNGDVEIIYFKANNNNSLSININKARVFDTLDNDSFIINSNDNTINTTYGADVIRVEGGVNNKVVLHDLKGEQSEQHISIANNTGSLNAVKLIYNTDFINGPLKIKTNSGSEHYIVVFGNKTATVFGAIDISHNDVVVKYETIHSLTKNFSELFETVTGHNVIFNESFIDDYINATYSKFNLILDEYKILGISQEHANYIISKITQYEKDLNLGLGSYKNYINDKVTDFTIDNSNLQLDVTNYINDLNSSSLPDSVKYIINEKVISFKESIYSNNADMLILKDLSFGNFNRLMTPLINDVEDNITVNNMYHKKETKNYVLTEVNGHMTYVWDGEYYYNRMVDGVQVDKFYDNKTSVGDLINYYEDNILVRSSNGRNVSGSDGNDILISSGNVYGQSNIYGITGNEAQDDVISRQNGNDILIGRDVYAYSGNNFISATFNAYGGRGNDFIISWKNIYADQSYLYNGEIEESSTSYNTLIQKGDGFINSSNGSNTIISFSRISQINATGNDLIISSSSNALIFGNYEAYQYYKLNKFDYFGRNIGKFNDLTSNFINYQETEDFYNHYNIANSVNNKIYINNGAAVAILGKYDFIDTSLNTSASFVIGLGYNEIIITNNTNVYSYGNSTIEINGNNNYIKLGLNDNFTLNNANNNDIYSRGYDQNISLNNDYYELNGNQNKLYIDNSNSTIKLLGSNSTILFSENAKTNYINSTEIGETTIEVGQQNKLNITATNKIRLLDGYVGILNVNTIHDVYTKGLNADSITIMGDLSKSQVNFFGDTQVNDVYIQAADIIGQLNDVKDVYLSGTLRFFYIYGMNTNLQIDGFVQGMGNSMGEFSGISNFIYNQTLNTTETSLFRIIDSKISNYISNGNSSVQLENTSIDNLFVDGYKTMLSGEIHNVQISNTNSFSIGATKNDIFNVNGTNLKLTATNSESIYVSYNSNNSSAISGVGISSMTVDANSNYKFNFFISDSGKLVFNSGYFTGSLINVTETIINIDKIRSGSSFDGDNISIIAGNNLSLAIGYDVYAGYQKQINGITFMKLPESVTVGAKTYSSSELNDIFGMLSSSIATNPKAILSESSIVVNGIDNLYGSNGAIYDANGHVIGNDNNNVLYLTKDRQYIVNAGKGDDIIDFGSASLNYQHIVKYKQGDGSDIIRTNGDKVLIQLTDILSSDITFKPYIVNENKNIQIYFKNELIITLEGFSVADVQVQATDKTYLKPEINDLISTIYGTDGNDVIDGYANQNTYIMAGKGNDTINFVGNNKNVLYYNRGDGADTINSAYAYEVIFGDNISKNQLTYIKVSDNKFDLYLDFRLINKVMTINEADKATFKFKNGDSLTGASIISGNSILNQSYIQEKPYINDDGIYFGTDTNDTYDLSALQQYHLYGGKGDDSYYFDAQNNFDNELDYYIGDGVDTIFNNYTKLKINLKDISTNDIRIEKGLVNNSLYIYYDDQKIMDIRDVLNSQIIIQTLDSIIDSDNLKAYLNAPITNPDDFYGTNSNDTIYGESGHINNIYGGKGDDIIIIDDYDSSFAKNIYYNLGDGHDIISSRSNFTLIFGADIDSSKLTYETSLETSIFKIYYDNVKIITIEKALQTQSNLYFKDTETSAMILNKIMESLTTTGTSGDDIINSTKIAEVISTGLGDDVININSMTYSADINAGGGDDEINILTDEADILIKYNIGDGTDTINLEGYDNSITVKTNISKENFIFRYDSSNINNLNIYYIDDAQNEVHALIVNNYIQNGSMPNELLIIADNGTISSSNIKDSADNNLTANYSLDSLIDTMSTLNDDEDITGPTQNISTTLSNYDNKK